jgi:hypothetical protein
MENLLEELFVMTYYIQGMTYENIENMNSLERKWFIKRLYKQKKAEIPPKK